MTGTVAGLEDPDNAALQISNMVLDTIKPDITMFLHYETIYENEKKIVDRRHSTWNRPSLLYC